MKKCPQCNTVYGNEVVYCLKDGATLIEETFSLSSTVDSIEEETVIRHEPIIVDLGANAEPQNPTIYQVSPASENVVVIPAKRVSPNKNYLIFLIIGLVLGGSLVLGTLLLSKSFFQNENSNSAATNKAGNSTKVISVAENQNKNVNVNTVSETPSNKHDKQSQTKNDEDFNGRVISLNARVRSSPSADSSAVETLPMNDRLTIIRRENPNSPWYEIECEHGTSGWMHGNTIEFTK